MIKLGISTTLAGVTFLAFANGAPDVLTAIVAGSSSSSSTVLIPFGSIFGALIFSGCFILGSVISKLPSSILIINKRQVLVPLGFYAAGMTFLLLIAIFYKKMNIYIALSLFAMYIM